MTGEEILSSGEALRRHETVSAEMSSFHFYQGIRWTDNDLGRLRPGVSASYTASRDETPSWTVDTLASSATRRLLSSDGSALSHRITGEGSLEWVAVNNEDRTLSFTCGVSLDGGRTHKKMFTTDSIDLIPVEDIAGSYDFHWNTLSSAFYSSVSYTDGKLSFLGRVGLDRTSVSDTESHPDELRLRRTFWSVRPQMSLMAGKFRMEVSAMNQLPSVEQIRDRISDSNPLVLTGGNPSLRQEYDLKGSASWSLMAGKWSCNLLTREELRLGSIVSKYTRFSGETVLPGWDGYVAPAGSMLYTWDNAESPGVSSALSARFSRTMLRRKLSTAITLSAAYTGLPMYMGEEAVRLSEKSASLSSSLRFTPSKKWRLSLLPSVSYIKSERRGASLLSERLNYGATASGSLNLAGNVQLSLYYSASGSEYLCGIGRDIFRERLSASVDWKLLSNSLTLSLAGYDLLNSGSLYAMKLSAESMAQTWNPAYGRYFMLTARYFFRRKK